MTEEPTNEVVAFQRSYVDLLDGDVMAALMLSQIFYWYQPAKNGGSKLRVLRQGKWWLAKSTKDWNAELGMTLKQARRCMDVLISKGIIEAEIMRFDGSPTQHCRLVCVEGKKVLNCPSEVFHLSFCKLPFAPEGKTITETTTQTTTETLYATEVAGDGDMKLNDVMAKLEAKKSAVPTGKVTASGMAMLWKSRMSLLNDGNYQKELTSKEVGQLKHLIKPLGDRCFEVLDWALQNWSAFAWEVKAKKGLTTAPEQPVIGFLVQYHDVAVQLIAIPAPVKPVKASAPLFDKPTLVKDTSSTEKVGADEIAATMALLNQMSGS
jgi:hypothetical protein